MTSRIRMLMLGVATAASLALLASAVPSSAPPEALAASLSQAGPPQGPPIPWPQSCTHDTSLNATLLPDFELNNYFSGFFDYSAGVDCSSGRFSIEIQVTLSAGAFGANDTYTLLDSQLNTIATGKLVNGFKHIDCLLTQLPASINILIGDSNARIDSVTADVRCCCCDIWPNAQGDGICLSIFGHVYNKCYTECRNLMGCQCIGPDCWKVFPGTCETGPSPVLAPSDALLPQREPQRGVHR